MLDVSEDLRAACLLEGIELGEAIGAGGSSTVWAARWRGRAVALKVFEGERPRTPPLAHPAIVEVLAEGRALGRSYQLLPRFPTDLGRLLGGRPLRADLRRAVLLPLLDAVDYAHGRGVAHGDLKPANVLVDPDARPPRVALTDFGQEPAEAELELSLRSAERRELRAGVGTLPYLAPERLAGEPASFAGDVYALGVLLFELATGRLPHGLELPSELAPDVDPRFDALVKRAMARDPERRLESVAALRAGLLAVLRPASGRAERAEPRSDMVAIPAGFVVLGDAEDPAARPMREVRLRAFRIDRTPVTNAEFLRYVQATGAARPPAWPARGRVPRHLLDLPVSGVTCPEAESYAAWAGKRLPTEEEWERAAQGPEHRRYPWGDAPDPTRIHGDPRSLSPVGSHPEGATSEGVLDLVGNGWEWTASPFRPGHATERAVRGGVDPQDPRSGTAHARRGLRVDARDPGLTFRCAMDLR